MIVEFYNSGRSILNTEKFLLVQTPDSILFYLSTKPVEEFILSYEDVIHYHHYIGINIHKFLRL